jgi:hypothetical protein
MPSAADPSPTQKMETKTMGRIMLLGRVLLVDNLV